MLTLGDLHIGQDAIIRVVGGEGELRHHLLDMGLTPGTEVTLRKTAPMGDPIEVELRGYELTLRLADAQKIEIDSVHATDRAAPSEERHKVVAHPGVGELDKAASYHERKAGAPIAAGAPLTFALAGNQNCGKTTLFNQLTGSNQHVGNFPGVTVDRKDGVIRNHKEATVTDLPGIYSLSPYSNEEIVTRDFILSEHPSGIINIVDASNIERNLYLTMQLMELDTPMVLALNMMDEVRANGGTIMVNALEELLGVPVVPMAAGRAEGLDTLKARVRGVIEGEEINLVSIATQSHYEVLKYVSIINFYAFTSAMTFNLNWFNSLSAEDQALIQECSAEARDYAMEQTQRIDEESLQTCLDQKMEVNYIEGAQRQEFIDAVQPVYEKYMAESDHIKAYVEMAQALQG